MATVDDATRAALLRRGFALEYVTLAWNVVGIIVLAIAAVLARSVALAGFGLDSLIEIGASTVVIWELSGTGADRQRRGLRLIGYAFAALAAYLLVQSTVVLVTGYHPRHSVLGIAWTSVTAVAMFALAFGKARTGKALGNPVLQTEGRVTLIDGILATAVLAALALNAALGWWWADPAAGYVLVFYAAREILLRPSDLDRSRRFYRDMLDLAIYREFGPPDDPGVVFFPCRDCPGSPGTRPALPGTWVMIWIQVRDVHAEHARLAAAGVPSPGSPQRSPGA